MRKKIIAKERDYSRNNLDHTKQQKNVINEIHKAHRNGKSKLEPGNALTGKDKNHIYLKTTHKDTGKTHHIAIHKDGTVKDPHVLHKGEFDPKGLKEQKKAKKIPVKKEIKNDSLKAKVIKKSNLKIKNPSPAKKKPKKIFVAEKAKQEDESKKLKAQIIKQAKEEVAYNRAEKSGKKEDYEAYIRFYPESEFVSFAKKKIEALKAKASSNKAKKKKSNKRKKKSK